MGKRAGTLPAIALVLWSARAWAGEPDVPPPAPPGPAPSEASVSGTVRARGDRRPIAGASVVTDGAPAVLSDAEGRFVYRGPAGAVSFRITASGFRENTFAERLEPGQQLEVVYALEPLAVNPYESVVVGDRARTEVSRVSLRAQEIHEVPGTLGDPFRAVMLMPGVASLSSGLAYPVVRGGQPAATGFFIDGVRIPMLYHLLLGPAVVQPEFLDGLDYLPGAAPARYGGLIGGVVEGRASRPRDDRFHASGYVDLLNSGVMLEQPWPDSGTNVTLAGRYSYSALLAALGANVLDEGPVEETYSANFWDYQGRLEQRFGTLKLRVLALGSSDRFGWDQEPTRGGAEPPQNLRVWQEFHRLDLRARSPLGGGELEVGLTLGSDSLGGTDSLRDTGKYVLGERSGGVRAGFARDLSAALRFEAGASLEQRRGAVEASGNLVSPLTEEDANGRALHAPSTTATIAGLHLQAIWRPGEAWTVMPGIRCDSYHLVPEIDHVAIDPRLAVRWQLDEALTLKAGAGLYHQPPTMLVPAPVAELSGLRHGLQEAVQTSLGTEWRGRGFEASVEAFYNPLLRSVELSLAQAVANRGRPDAYSVATPTHGHAYGVELMLRRPLGGGWFGWLSYSFTQSKRWAQFDRTDALGETVGTQEAFLPFAFEQAHVANAAVSYRFPGNFTLGAALQFHTGRPETGELSSRTMRTVADPEEGTVWKAVDRDQAARLPSHLRFDLRAAKTWALDAMTLEAYLDVFNVTMAKEVYGHEYRSDLSQRALALPVFMPLLGLKGAY